MMNNINRDVSRNIWWTRHALLIAMQLLMPQALAQTALIWTATYGGAEPHRAFGASNQFGDPVLLDFDGDTAPDPVVSVTLFPGPGQRGVNVILSGATGDTLRTFDTGGVSPLPTPDLDGDSVPDLWTIRFADGVARLGLYSGAAILAGAEPAEALLGLLAPPTSEPGLFGVYKTGGLDATGDGAADLAVLHAERVWLYSGAAVAGGQTAPVRSVAPPDAEALFAPHRNTKMALVPDLDGDGTADLLVSDPYFEPPGAVGIGVVYAFSGATGALIHRLTRTHAAIEIGFYGLAAIGGPPGSGPGAGPDLDGDGVPEIVVASTYSVTTAEGVIDIFSGATGALLRTHFMPEPHPNSNFGRNLRVVPDADGDGVADLLTVAWLNPSQDEFGPRVVLVIGSDTGAELMRVEDPEGSTSSSFGGGYLASVMGDDGRTRLFVSAPGADVEGQTDAGAVYAFALLPVAGESAPSPASPSSPRVSIAPNPAHSSASLTLTLGAPSSVAVTVVDALGRVVRRVEAGALAAGAHRLALGVDGLPPGVYVVRITTGDGAASARLVVGR